MDKAKAQQHIQKNLAPGDELIGFFYAIQPYKFWMFLLMGPLAVLSMKYYFVAVTKAGITFHRMTMLGKFADADRFAYAEVATIKIGKGLLQRPMLLTFKNGRKLKIKAQLKGVDKVAKLTDDVQRYLESHIAAAK
jgi:hypothetical protein